MSLVPLKFSVVVDVLLLGEFFVSTTPGLLIQTYG